MSKRDETPFYKNSLKIRSLNSLLNKSKEFIYQLQNNKIKIKTFPLVSYFKT